MFHVDKTEHESIKKRQNVSASTQQRCDVILTEVFEKGHVTVKDLADELDVSKATIRRDLRTLADTGQVELVYGGARRARKADYSFRAKALRNVEAKKIVGRLAAEMVGDDEQVFLDSGTTVYEMACRLKQHRGLRTIVNSARLALELDASGISVIMLGGQYRPDRMDTVGPLAMDTLEQLRGYVAYIGADGLSMEFGLTASDIESAHLFRLATRNARECVLLVDHTKFQAPSLCRIVDWGPICRVVTDRPPSLAWRAFLDERNIAVICPESDPDNENEDETEAGPRPDADGPATQPEP